MKQSIMATREMNQQEQTETQLSSNTQTISSSLTTLNSEAEALTTSIKSSNDFIETTMHGPEFFSPTQAFPS